MKPKAFQILFIFSTLALFSCVDKDNKDDEDTIRNSLGWQYFPLDIGRYISYQADSIFHDKPDPNIPGVHDTTRYFIKEYIESEFTDAAGEVALRLERYKKISEDEPWELADVWFIKRRERAIDKIEENERFVKLSIPVSATSLWDGNAMNTLPEWRYRYDSLYVPRSYSELSFNNTIKVLQRNNKNFVEDELAYEIYAENIGLVYRYHRDLDTRLDYTSQPIAQNIRKGIEFTWRIIDYGME